jgi:hypothetical protein
MDGTIGNLTNTYHGLAHANIACSGAAYTFSIFAKQGNKVGVQLDFDGASTVTFNLATGAVITNSFPATVEARIVKCGGDICRPFARRSPPAIRTRRSTRAMRLEIPRLSAIPSLSTPGTGERS